MSASSSFDIKVQGVVPQISQQKQLGCWATVATIMQSWHDNITHTVEETLDKADAAIGRPFFRDTYDKDEHGLKSTDKDSFLKALNLIGEPPANYTIDKYKDLLQHYGPLWVTTYVPPDPQSGDDWSTHARVVDRIFGDGSTNNTRLEGVDPSDGTRFSQTIDEFSKIFEQVIEDPDIPAEAQIVHFP